MAIRYLSEDWAELALERIDSDPAIRKAIAKVNMGMLAIILDAPAHCYSFIYVCFKDGHLNEYRVGFEYEEVVKDVEPTLVITGNYDVFAAITRGETSERRAVMSGKLHVTGGMFRALRYMNAMETITEALSSIECET